MSEELFKELKDFRLIAQALSKDIRIKILSLISQNPINVKNIARKLKIPVPTATVNIKLLEEADLILKKSVPGIHGVQKVCSLKYNSIFLNLLNKEVVLSESVSEISMPIGHFIDCEVYPTCGLAGLRKRIGKQDQISSFYLPEKIQAHLIWVGKHSKLKYNFPLSYPINSEISSLQLSCELCSEAKGYKDNFSSDITLWINNIEVGTWTSPGDFGGAYGKLTPRYWKKSLSQYGLLTNWKINSNGTFINEEKISDISIDQIKIQGSPFVSIKIGVKQDSANVNGFNLFGSKFGNYDQDIILKIHYIDI